MRLAPGAAALCAASFLLVPTAHASLLSGRVTAPAAVKRACEARPAPPGAAGVVQRSVRATADGLVRARLHAPAGDWDVAVFAGRRLVAGAAATGARELAEGVAARGTQLTVQACRRSGATRSADLRVDVVPVARGAGERIQLVRVQTPTRGARLALEASGLDLTEHARASFREVLVHGARDLAALRKLGLPFAVEIADVVAADRRAMRSGVTAGPEDLAPMPSGRTQYRRLVDFQSEMKTLAQQNPGLVRSITLPEPSLEGRAVEGIEISQDVAADDGKPVFLQMGIHHAREWPSAEMPMEWAIELINRHRGGEERARRLLSQIRVIVVPVINPDGFNLSRESLIDSQQPVVDPAFAYKRKNCRVRDFAIPAPGECGQTANRRLGTDPNRNYGGFWGGPGASTALTNDTYRGAQPFSEPETRNVQWLVSTRQVTTLITNHTYSDLVLRPPGLVAEGDPPDEPVYKKLGDDMAAENGYLSQKSWELYDTTGTTEDWSYYATGGLGFTFEIGKAHPDQTLAGVGFHPAYPLGVVAEYYGKYPGGGGNREAYFVAAESTADRTRHSVIAGRAPAGATLRVRKSFDTYTSRVLDERGFPGERIAFRDTLEDTMTVPADGRFTWSVNPSTRPFARKQRVDTQVADAPASSQDISSALPSSPPTVGQPIGREIPFTVTAGANRLILATIDGVDGDDYDLFLERDGQDVASAASDTADETLVYADATPGQYTLRIENWLATGGYTGSLQLYAAKAGSETLLPFGTEAWTLTCEVGGRVAGLQDVVVDRGQAVSVAPCGPEARQQAAQAGVLGHGTTATGGSAKGAASPRFAFAIDRRRLRTALRRGMRARVRCSATCRPRLALTVAGPTARRLGLARSSRRAVTVARGTVSRSFAGRRTFTVRFTKSARRRLAGVRSLRLRAVGRARVGSRTLVQRRSLALR